MAPEPWLNTGLIERRYVRHQVLIHRLLGKLRGLTVHLCPRVGRRRLVVLPQRQDRYPSDARGLSLLGELLGRTRVALEGADQDPLPRWGPWGRCHRSTNGHRAVDRGHSRDAEHASERAVDSHAGMVAIFGYLCMMVPVGHMPWWLRWPLRVVDWLPQKPPFEHLGSRVRR